MRRILTMPTIHQKPNETHQMDFGADYYKEDFAFVNLLKACIKKKDLYGGSKLHDDILKRGLLVKSPYLASTLINMYAKCGVIAKAQQVLEELSAQDTISWNALITGYIQQGQGHEALTCFQRMQSSGCSPDVVTFTCILKACGITGAVDKGKQIHAKIANMGILEKDAILGTSLVNMYARCGDLVQAKEVLKNLSVRDLISWNALIAGYVQLGEYHEVLNCFECMQNEGLSPDAVTFVYLLKACGSVGAIGKGQSIHEEIIQRCSDLLETDIVLGTALVDMYAKCGMFAKSQLVFEGLLVRNGASWNALIAGYAQHGQCHKASNCFEQMKIEGLSPDVVTFICILKACACEEAIDKGRKIHDEIASRGLVLKDTMLGNALVDMYAKCGVLTTARQVLDELEVRDLVSWNILLTGYSKKGCINEALNCIEQMESEGISPDGVTFICILKACTITRALEKGTAIHTEIVIRGLLQKDTILGNVLVDMYAQCGMLAGARRILEELPIRNVVSWNALIGGHVQLGQGREALDCFEQMQKEGLFPDVVTFICILKACGSTREVHKGKQFHDEIVARGLLKQDDFLGYALVDMYAKCGLLAKAQEVFEKLRVRNIISWSALIAGYVQDGLVREALTCFEKMQSEGFSPDVITFYYILKACGDIGDRAKGRQVHEKIVNGGFLEQDMLLGVAIVDMYVKCGQLEKARQVLGEIPIENVVSSSAFVLGCVQWGKDYEEGNFIEQMHGDSISSNAGILICILKACGRTGAVNKGIQIHDEIENRGLLQNDIKVGNALMDMYAKCGMLEKAQGVLNELLVRDRVSWNILISAYTQKEHYHQALDCFHRMQSEAVSPDTITFTCVLKACGNNESIKKGKQIQSMIVTSFLLEKDSLLGNALMDMYIKSGFLGKAQEVLEYTYIRDVISWNAMILGYVQYDRGNEALNCFEWMQSEGLSPDVVTFICILKACGNIGAVHKGKQIHSEIVSRGLLEKEIVLGNALVDMYVKCGFLVKAQKVMEELPFQNEVSWSALIGGYAQQEQGHEALACYEKMQNEGISANAVTFICILKACGSIGAIDKGEQIHEEIIKRGLLVKNIMLGNALVDMYAKCGMITKAAQVLKEFPIRNVVTWNALIAGYAQEGRGQEALNCFDEMQSECLTPDEVTFLCVLSACSHSGLHNEAEMLFQSMTEKFGIMPKLEHQGCMVMVFAFAGLFNKAMSVIEVMPSFNFIEVCLALLGACRKWGNVKLARLAFERAVQVDRSCAAPYVLMATIYIAAGMRKDAQKVEAMKLKCVSFRKKQGNSILFDADASKNVNIMSASININAQSFKS